MVSVEERYGVSLTAAEMSAVESVDDLRRLLAAKHAQH
jgi:acyl carrier protein